MKKSFIMILCICMTLSQIYAQTKKITGTITDDKGAPVSGASILVKGTTVGTNSMTDGSFVLSVVSPAKSIIVSSVNFTTQEINLGNKTDFQIKLVSSAANLDEVVVVGYANINKSSLTGSVGKVSGNEIANRPVLSFDQALAGKAAGVQINTSSGLVGDNVLIRIRGAASISSGSQPLIVMDGVPITQGNNIQLYNPVNTLADINPNDIENIELLKDASAASLYGSRASAGVILITTKKGKSGQATFNYDSYVGFNEPSKKINVLDADQYVSVINKMRTNAGLGASASLGDYNGDGQPDKTDWQNEIYRKGLTQSHQIGISGGSGKTTYYASIGYNDFNNYIIINRQKRSSARLNLTTKVTDWLDIGIKTQYSRTNTYGLGSGTGGALSGVPFGPLTAYPNAPVFDANGDYYIGSAGNTVSQNTPNPVAVQKTNFDTRDTRRYIASTFAELTLMKGLKLKSQYNIDYLSAYTDQYWGQTVGDGAGLGGLTQNVYNEKRVWSWFNTLNYNTRIGDHDISLLAGSEYTKTNGFSSYTFGYTIFDPLFRDVNPANFANTGATNAVDGMDGNTGLASYFGGLNYGYKSKYLASFNIRGDAYSGFGKDNRWGYFPSGSVAWKVSKENFWHVNAVSDLKVRASYGITGNSSIGDFPALATFAPNQYADLPALTLLTPGNANLRWEQTAQLDIGFDATVGKNIGITVDYYHKKTKDLILNNPILATIGFPNNIITQNVGRIDVQGLEFAINVPVVSKKDFTYDLNFNGAWNKNKVISTNEQGDDITSGNTLARPGYDLSAFYLIRWAGVNPDNGLPTFLDVNGVRKQYDPSKPSASRWSLVSDKSPTTAITGADRVLENKTPYPKFFGGLTQNLKFKNFDLVVDLQYSLGGYTYNSTTSTLLSYTSTRNKSTAILNAWTKPGDVTDIPALYYGENQSAQASTRWLEKSDFARIRNLQLGYNFSKSLLERAKITHLRVYAQIQNAYTFTGYSGTNPDANNTTSPGANLGLGIDNFRPILPRTFTIGVNVGF